MEIAVRDELFIKVSRESLLLEICLSLSLSLSFAVCVTLSACVPGKKRKRLGAVLYTYVRRDDVLINSTA